MARKSKSKTNIPAEPWDTCGCCIEKGLIKYWSSNSEKLCTCSNCGVKWHKSCARGTNPKLCDICVAGLTDPPTCVICRKADKRGFYKQTTEGEWGHLVCAKWSTLTFLNDDYLIEGLDNIDTTSFKQRCVICNNWGGECIKCVYGRCSKSVHPLCAKSSDEFLMIEVVWEKLAKNELQRYIEMMQIEDSSEVNRLWVPRFGYCGDHKKYYKSKDPFKHLLSTNKRKINIRKRLHNFKTMGRRSKKTKVEKLVWDTKLYNGVKFLFVNY